MKREERRVFNGLRKNVDEKTIYVEVPTAYTKEARQEIHEMLTIEKHMYAVRVCPCAADLEKNVVLYYHCTVSMSTAEKQAQEATDIDTLTGTLPVSVYTWNGYRAPSNEEEPETTTTENNKEDETMTTTNAATTFPRLFAEISANYDRLTANTFHYIEKGWFPSWSEANRNNPDAGLKRYSTPRRWEQYQAGEITREKAVELANRRAAKEIEKFRAVKLARIESVAAAPALEIASVYVTWAKSRTWGANPSAELYDGNSNRTTGHASGCGYDKESAAIAEAMNANPAALRILYELGEAAMQRGESPKSKTACSGYHWGGCIGYGAGYDVLPYYEGGVGSSCFWSILEKAGYTVKHAGSGRMSDCWTISRS